MHNSPIKPVDREELTTMVKDALAAAYEQGCRDVHANYEPQQDPEFGEAASDYAASNAPTVLSLLSTIEELERERDEQPCEPGGYEGDIFFGDPKNSTRGTHRWTKGAWEPLPSDEVVLMELLAEARCKTDVAEALLREAVEDVLSLTQTIAEWVDMEDGPRPTNSTSSSTATTTS